MVLSQKIVLLFTQIKYRQLNMLFHRVYAIRNFVNNCLLILISARFLISLDKIFYLQMQIVAMSVKSNINLMREIDSAMAMRIKNYSTSCLIQAPFIKLYRIFFNIHDDF